MKLPSLLAAIVAGALGAFLWAVIAHATDMEIGYLAWGIGIGVGTLSYLAGGRGVANGVACVVITLASIFAGKMLTVKMISPSQIKEEMRKDSRAAGLSEQELDQAANAATSSITYGDAFGAAASNLGVIDIAFGIIGAMSAFRVGSGKNAQPKPAAPTSAPAVPAQPAPAVPISPAAEPAPLAEAAAGPPVGQPSANDQP